MNTVFDAMGIDAGVMIILLLVLPQPVLRLLLHLLRHPSLRSD